MTKKNRVSASSWFERSIVRQYGMTMEEYKKLQAQWYRKATQAIEVKPTAMIKSWEEIQILKDDEFHDIEKSDSEDNFMVKCEHQEISSDGQSEAEICERILNEAEFYLGRDKFIFELHHHLSLPEVQIAYWLKRSVFKGKAVEASMCGKIIREIKDEFKLGKHGNRLKPPKKPKQSRPFLSEKSS